MKKHSIATALVATAALCGAGAAQAQVAGQVMVKLGWNKIMPKVRSTELSAPSLPGSTIDIKSASALFFTATYMITDDISVEALGGLPYKHDIIGTGSVSWSTTPSPARTSSGRLNSAPTSSPTARRST